MEWGEIKKNMAVHGQLATEALLTSSSKATGSAGKQNKEWGLGWREEEND